jgi:ABC-type multidrug transport system permease subunit
MDLIVHLKSRILTFRARDKKRMAEKEIGEIIGGILFSFIFMKLSVSIFQNPGKAAKNLSTFYHQEMPFFRYIAVNKIFGPTAMILYALIFLLLSVGAGIHAVVLIIHLFTGLS